MKTQNKELQDGMMADAFLSEQMEDSADSCYTLPCIEWTRNVFWTALLRQN